MESGDDGGAAEPLARPESSGDVAPLVEAEPGGSPAAHDGEAAPGSSLDGEQQQLEGGPDDMHVGQQEQLQQGEQQEEQQAEGEQLPEADAFAEGSGPDLQQQQQQQQADEWDQDPQQPADDSMDAGAAGAAGAAAQQPYADPGASDDGRQQLQYDEQAMQQEPLPPAEEHERDPEQDAAAAEAAAAAAEAAQAKLNELEAALRQPDAVMEPPVMDHLREYVMANGHPQAAVEYLTESYTGYAQMASLVCSWLKMTEPDSSSAAAAAAAASTGADAAAGGGDGAGAGPGGLAAAAGLHSRQLDEAAYLRQLAKERFDPQLFATVFTSGGSGAPQWLNGLIAEPEGRQLVYELAGRYKNSLLLNFAIHKILMQPGREKEVAAVGGSLAGYFGVFHRLMAAKLREGAAAGDERALEQLARGLKEDCCASQHTYVHAQQVLLQLARHPHGARFRRIAQELEEHAAALHGPVVWKMRQWFVEPGQPEAHNQAAALLADILASSASGAPPASEVAKLHRLYCPQEPDQQPPPIAFLRHPRVFEVLLHNLFSPGRQLQPEAAAAYSGLLALAAAADDQRAFGPADAPAANGAAAAQEAAAAADSDAAAAAADTQQQQAQQQQQGSGQLDLSAVPATRAALETAAELAQRVMRDQKAQPADMEAAAAVLEYPCCAAGLLRALGAQLARPEYWQTAYHLQKRPPFLQLLGLLVPRQAGLHGALLGLLGRALGALGNTNHDMAKGFLSVAVQLVSAGRVFEVLRWAEEWKARADPSLVRHLVFGVLEVSAPPYSPDFAASMLRIMTSAGIRRQRLSARDWGIKALLDEFAAACAQVQFKPPLSAREAQFLQDISADRPPGAGGPY